MIKSGLSTEIHLKSFTWSIFWILSCLYCSKLHLFWVFLFLDWVRKTIKLCSHSYFWCYKGVMQILQIIMVRLYSMPWHKKYIKFIDFTGLWQVRDCVIMSLWKKPFYSLISLFLNLVLNNHNKCETEST